MQVSFQVEAEKKTHTFNLTGLQALTEYEVALSCAVQQSAFWSAWSPVHRGATEEGECRPPRPSTCPGRACPGWVIRARETPAPEPGCPGLSLAGSPRPQAEPGPGCQPRSGFLSRRKAEPAQRVLGEGPRRRAGG